MQGNANNRLQAIASNANLDKVGRSAGIEKFVQLAGGTSVVSAKTMASTVEAILGAVFKDSQGDLVDVKRGMVAFGLM